MSDNIKRPDGVTRRAIEQCARWLYYCLSIGWKKSDLDALEAIWWQHHDRFGKLTRA